MEIELSTSRGAPVANLENAVAAQTDNNNSSTHLSSRRRPVSMEGLEAATSSVVVTDEDVMRVARVCKDVKIGNYFGFLSGILMIVMIGTTLIMERRDPCRGFLCVPCDTNLPLWAFVLLLSQIFLLPLRAVLHMQIPTVSSVTTPSEAVDRLNRFSRSIWYNTTRAFRVFTSIWFVVGMIWARQSVNCESSKIFYICFVLIVVFIIVAGFFLLYTLAFLTFRLFNRSATLSMPTFRRVPRPGLSEKAIESLPSKRFHPGSIPVDDAICAICLAEYVPGEKIRSLGNCVHHFHSTCIDTWLLNKKNCPLCNSPALKSKLKIKSITMTEPPAPFQIQVVDASSADSCPSSSPDTFTRSGSEARESATLHSSGQDDGKEVRV